MCGGTYMSVQTFMPVYVCLYMYGHMGTREHACTQAWVHVLIYMYP